MLHILFKSGPDLLIFLFKKTIKFNNSRLLLFKGQETLHKLVRFAVSFARTAFSDKLLQVVSVGFAE